jgi:hypothetical protein
MQLHSYHSKFASLKSTWYQFNHRIQFVTLIVQTNSVIPSEPTYEHENFSLIPHSIVGKLPCGVKKLQWRMQGRYRSKSAAKMCGRRECKGMTEWAAKSSLGRQCWSGQVFLSGTGVSSGHEIPGFLFTAYCGSYLPLRTGARISGPAHIMIGTRLARFLFSFPGFFLF